MKPQTKQVLARLNQGSMTARDAIGMVPPCWRLAARIDELRNKHGVAVRMDYEPHPGGRHARYTLEQRELEL